MIEKLEPTQGPADSKLRYLVWYRDREGCETEARFSIRKLHRPSPAALLPVDEEEEEEQAATASADPLRFMHLVCVYCDWSVDDDVRGEGGGGRRVRFQKIFFSKLSLVVIHHSFSGRLWRGRTLVGGVGDPSR